MELCDKQCLQQKESANLVKNYTNCQIQGAVTHLATITCYDANITWN